MGKGSKSIRLNLLAKLYRLRNGDGESFISDDEFRAGERLRADFTRGSMMPSISARWDVGIRNSSRSGPGGMAELNDIALASRMRVERALEAVGPELSGVLIDVCCFLKGLETVERERQWPVRSGKCCLRQVSPCCTGITVHRHKNDDLLRFCIGVRATIDQLLTQIRVELKRIPKSVQRFLDKLRGLTVLT